MKRFRFPPIILLLAAACGKETVIPDIGNTEPAEIRIPVSQVPFFADLSNYNLAKSGLKDDTRSGDLEETVTLEELLDRAKTKTRSVGGYDIVQIAFRQNEENVYSLSSSINDDDGQEIPTRVKKFLVSASSATGKKYEFVAVLITSAEYYDANPQFDFFEKPAYTGTIFYCTPEGGLIQTNDYTDGRILGAKMLTPEESLANTDPDTKRIILLKPANTRGELITHWSGEPAMCIDYKPKDKPGGGGVGYDGNDIDFGWGSDKGPGSNTQDPEWDNFGIGILLPNIPPEIPQMYKLKLATNAEDITILGNGIYEQGTIIHIDFSTNYLVLDYYAIAAKFRYWTGTFRLKNTVAFDYKVMENVESTAYFDLPKAPCHNEASNLTNPLSNMRVAPTDSGDYLKGLYHKVIRRYDKVTNEPIYHWGLDLAAPEGTPIYATATGRIVKLKKDCPRGRKGNKYNGCFGNEIIIACEGFIEPYADDGNFPSQKTVYIQYAHLQHGNAIAFNYREGRPFQKGDIIYAGDIIGYTGSSGNAWNVAHPHLHYGISFDGNDDGRIAYHSWIDPADFINGEIDLEQLKQETQNKVADGGLIKTTDCY